MKRFLSILLAAASTAGAQCVMCFRTAAAQQSERARVLDIGIIVMMIPPVLILAGFCYLAYRRRSAFAETPAESAAGAERQPAEGRSGGAWPPDLKIGHPKSNSATLKR